MEVEKALNREINAEDGLLRYVSVATQTTKPIDSDKVFYHRRHRSESADADMRCLLQKMIAPAPRYN